MAWLFGQKTKRFKIGRLGKTRRSGIGRWFHPEKMLASCNIEKSSWRHSLENIPYENAGTILQNGSVFSVNRIHGPKTKVGVVPLTIIHWGICASKSQ